MVLNLHRVALTGAGGVLGRHAVAALARRGVEIVRLTRSRWDLREWKESAELDALIGPVDAVLHFGALTPHPGEVPSDRDLMDANVRACAVLGTWAAVRGVPLVYAGSAGIYAPAPGPTGEDAPQAACPLGGLYGLSKLLGERLLLGLTAERGLKLCALRIASLYGTGMDAGKLVPAWLAAAGRGETIAVSPPADDAVNLVHAVDVAHAALDALAAETWGVFNIAGPGPVTMAELARTCVSVAGGGSVRISDAPAPRTPECRFDVSSSRAAAAFGYRAEISLREGLTLMRERKYDR